MGRGGACCCDRSVCEWILRIGCVIAGLLGLGLVGCGLYMTFGPETATQDVQEFLKLASIADTFRLVVRFPWIIVIVGAVVFLGALASVLCMRTKFAQPFYCCFSTILYLCGALTVFMVVVMSLASQSVR